MSMKIGTQTGNMMNHIYSRATKGQPDPVVGMGATVLLWSDRTAGTIISVEKLKNGNIIIGVQHDNAKLASGTILSEDQEYEYTPNPEGRVEYFRWNGAGAWGGISRNPKTGRWIKGGKSVIIGKRMQYRDPSF